MKLVVWDLNLAMLRLAGMGYCIAYVGYVQWLSDLRCGWVDKAHTGSTSDLLIFGDPAVGCVVAIIVIEVQAFYHTYVQMFFLKPDICLYEACLD